MKFLWKSPFTFLGTSSLVLGILLLFPFLFFMALAPLGHGLFDLGNVLADEIRTVYVIIMIIPAIGVVPITLGLLSGIVALLRHGNNDKQAIIGIVLNTISFIILCTYSIMENCFWGCLKGWW